MDAHSRPLQRRILHRFFAAFVVLTSVPSASDAQVNSIWNGTTGNWTNAALWSAGVPQNGQPSPGDLYNAIANGGGTITLDANIIIQALTFQNGTIAGSNSFTMNALTTWAGGTFGGTSSIFANGGANITGATTTMFLNGGSLTLGGAASTWSGGDINIDNGSVLTNSLGSTFIATGNNVLTRSSGIGTGTFVNQGTFRKQTGTGVTTINNNVAFINSGTVDVQTGTLVIGGGGSSTGPLTVAGGATINLAITSFALNAGSSIAGAGNVTFSSGTHTVAVPYTITGTTTINGGTANFNTDVTLPTFVFSTGTLGGNSAVTVTNPFTWSGGTFAGSGLVSANGGVAISGATATMALNGRPLTLGGTASTWSGGDINIDNGSVLTNSLGSTFTATGNNVLTRSSGIGTGTFVNQGTFRKQTGTGVTTINNNVAFINSGTVDVQTGTLVIGGGGSSTGPLTVAAGATINLAITSFDLNAGSSIAGAGNVMFSSSTHTVAVPYTTATTINGGTANFNGGPYSIPSFALTSGSLGGNATVNVSGATTWSGGTLASSATLLATGGATINGATSSSILNGGSLTLGGTSSTWSGTNIFIDNGSVLTNSLGSTFTATGDNVLTRSSGIGTGTFLNQGTFRKQTGTGVTTINNNVAFTNSGTLEVASGILTIVSAPDFTNLAANTLTGGTYRILSNSTFNISGATINALAANTTVELNGAGSTFAAINPLTTVDGTFAIRGGRTFTIAGPGLTVGANGTLTVGDANSVLTVPDAVAFSNFAGSTLANGAYQVLDGGTFDIGTRAIGTNSATVILSGPSSTFTAINGFTTNSGTGSFQIVGGRIFSLANNATNAGSITVGSGSALDINGLAHSGTLTIGGAVNAIGNTFTWTGANDIVGQTGGSWINQAAAVFDAQNNQALAVATGTPTFTNLGTLRKSVGAGTTTMNWGFTNSGTLDVQSGTMLISSGANFTNFAGGTLTGGTFRVGNGATFDLVGRTIATNSATIILDGLSSTFVAINGFTTNSATGNFQVLGGRVFTLSSGFTNAGAISVGDTSTLNVSGGSSAGSFTVGNGAFLQFNSNTFDLISGAGVSGAGATRFFGGIVNVNVPYTTATIINGGTANFNGGPYAIPSLSFSSGTLGGNAAIGVTGALAWSGGTFGGTSSVFANGGANITGATTSQILNGGSLTLGGTASTWSGGNVLIDNGSVLTNSATSVFTATGDNNVQRSSGTGTAAFTNAGTFRKQTGTGTTTIGTAVAFTNSGAVDVQTGTLALNGGGSSTGTFTVATALQFNGGTFDITSGAGVSGAGTTNFAGGTVNVAAPYTTTTTINGGTANFNGGPYSIPSFAFSSGTLGGNATVNVSGATTWSGGTFASSATLLATGGATITGATSSQNLNGGSLTLGGTSSTWSGGNIFIDNGSVLTNALGSVFTATGNNNVQRSSGTGTAAFTNAGTFRKQTGTGTTTIGTAVAFTNSGAVDVQTGTLALNGGLTNTGTVANALGTTISGSITSNTQGIVRGVGTFGGPLQFTSGSTLQPGLGPGILTVTGAVTMSSNATFATELNGPTAGTQYSQLLLSGGGASIDLGSGNLSTTLGYAPNSADSLTIIAGGTVIGTFGNAPAGQPFMVGTFSGVPYNALVTYSSNAVVLSGFVPVPEPTTVLAIAFGGLIVGSAIRRKRRRISQSA